jgi:phospholipid transport system substrate-binding protein
VKKALLGLSMTCIAGLSAFSSNAYAGAPKQRIESQVKAVLDVLRNPALKDESAQKEKEDKIWSIVHDIFDFTELSRRTLSRNWKRFNKDQRKEFEDLFTQFLGDVYMDRVLAYKDEEVVFEKETQLSEERVEVQSKVLTGGKEIPMYYRMVKKNDTWKVYDVIIEGVSLVMNYRSQFNQILSKNPPEELLKVLRKKVEER